ncbi:MAG TPA: DUF308 domain-containing protein [Gaiellaceae bacterium]|jgi:uncharacterized membrane protein HdeD (DUF308 family)
MAVIADATPLEQAELEGASRVWWLYLIVGILWLWVALIVLRLNLDSLYAISILFGCVAIGMGVSELFAIPASTTGWKIARGLLGALFIVAGIVAFFRPAGTFVALASLVAWVLLFKGVADVVVALMTRVGAWWFLLIVGILEIVVGFWAAGYFRGSAILLVAWIAALALMRGISEIFLAFRLRNLSKEIGPA